MCASLQQAETKLHFMFSKVLFSSQAQGQEASFFFKEQQRLGMSVMGEIP